MENTRFLFCSQMKRHWGTLVSGLLIGALIPIITFLISDKSRNTETLTNVLSEAKTPITFSLLFTILSLLISLNFLISFILKKEKYNRFFFSIYNILLGASIPNTIASLYAWESHSTYFKENYSLEILDVLGFAPFPISMLILHVLVDFFRPRNYSSPEDSIIIAFMKESIPCIIYLVFALMLFAVYSGFSLLSFVILRSLV